MHGRIFVIDTNNLIQIRGGELYEPPWEPWEIKDWIPGCDYVVHKPEMFEEDCQWFKQSYHLDNHCSFIKHNVFEVAVEPILSALEGEKRRRLDLIRNELAKDNPDMWEIKHLAWDSGFWFIIWDGSFGPEMDFLERLQIARKEGLERLLIVRSYDYHF